MKKSTKRLLSLVGIGAVGAHASLSIVANELFNEMFAVDKTYLDKDIADFLPSEEIKNKYLEQIDEQVDWYTKVAKMNLQIESYDGYKLDGTLLQINDEHRYMILVHGFSSDRYILLKQAYEFAKRGFNILMYDQRAYGKSEGEYTTFGFKEHLDLIQWINKLKELDSSAKIGLYGVSMGAVSVMLALGTKLDEAVCFAVEDSGYASLEAQLSYSLSKHQIRFKSLVLHYMERMIKNRLGFSFEDVKAIEALKRNDIPICFVHAKDDDIVLYDNANELYYANHGKKAIYPISSSGHAYACYEDDYFDDLMEFIEKYI